MPPPPAAESSVPVYTAAELLVPASVAGKGSHDLAHRRASTQFIEFMPPKQPNAVKQHDGTAASKLMYSWPVALPASFDYRSALNGVAGSGSGTVSDAAGHGGSSLVAANAPTTAMQMQMQLAGLGLDPRAFSHLLGTPSAGLTCDDIQSRVARTRLERRLQTPELQLQKKAYARRASTAVADGIMYQRPKAEEETSIVSINRKARRSLCLQPHPPEEQRQRHERAPHQPRA